MAAEGSADAVSREEISELDRRWAQVEADEPTIANEDIVCWLKN